MVPMGCDRDVPLGRRRNKQPGTPVEVLGGGGVLDAGSPMEHLGVQWVSPSITLCLVGWHWVLGPTVMVMG